MSIHVMSAVWKTSQQSGNTLLLLLALADNADDDGHCWPSIDHLTEKTRSSKATVMRNLTALENAGEVIVWHNRRRGNKYIVTVGKTLTQLTETVSAKFRWSEERISIKMRSIKMILEKSQNDTSEVSPVIHDPSITVIETPEDSADATAPAPTSNGHKPEAPAVKDKPTRKRSKAKYPQAVRTPMKDAIVAAFGWDASTITVWGDIETATNLLLDGGATPGDMPGLHKMCAARFENFGPVALPKHWPEYVKQRQTGAPTVREGQPVDATADQDADFYARVYAGAQEAYDES